MCQFSLIILVILSLFGCKTEEEMESPITCDIGDIGPAGGYVFYDKGETKDDWKYIEKAPSDLLGFEWGC